MSAWYLFSVMGFYLVCPGTPYYVIGSPCFNEVEIFLPSQKKFKVIVKNNSPENCYIKSAKLNGEPYNKTFLSHFDIIKESTIEFEMSSQSDTNWGCDGNSVPYSLSCEKIK